MSKPKKEIISIQGMMAKWNVSHMTIYRNYLPRLKSNRYKIKGKVYVDWDEAQKIHNEVNEKFKVIA